MRINITQSIDSIRNLSNKPTPPQNTEPKFIRPIIEPEQFKLTLNAYRKYVAAYNKPINEYNDPFRARNKSITHPPHNLIDKVIRFNKSNNNMEVEEYNVEAFKFNKTYGNHIRYRYKQTVKPASLLYFEAILHMYSVQLSQRNEINKKTNKNYKSSLPKVAVNSYHITTQERVGTLNLDVSTRTVRNHLYRLEEAGVLLEREFGGTNSPLKFKINPEILVILDDATRKNLNTENQRSTPPERKVFQDIKDNTRYINNNKRKETFNKSPDKDFASQSLKDLFYKITKPQLEDKKDEKQKISQKSSAKILQVLDRLPVFADKLANGEYDHYVPLKTSDLQRWITSTDITDEDYREIVIQDFIKTSAQLWKKNQASAGSWYESFRHIYNSYGTTNFTGKSLKRNDLYNWLMQMRYRLNYAIGWFKKREWRQVWYPNIYFDPVRTLPTDVSFAYTKKVWSEKLRKQEQRATQRRKERDNAIRRKEQLSKYRKEMKRLDGYIYRYINHEISIDDIAMVLSTMSEKVQEKFSDRLNYLTNKRLKDNE